MNIEDIAQTKEPRDMNVRVVISGRHYATEEGIPEQLSLDEGCSIDDALAKISEAAGEDRQLPRSCLLAVSGKHLGTLENHAPHTLCEGDEIVLIAPVAGG